MNKELAQIEELRERLRGVPLSSFRAEDVPFLAALYTYPKNDPHVGMRFPSKDQTLSHLRQIDKRLGARERDGS